MSQKEAVEIIRKAFADVEVVKIVVEYDSIVGGKVAKVFVRDDQLEAALVENGVIPRRAAIESGLDVEVVLASGLP